MSRHIVLLILAGALCWAAAETRVAAEELPKLNLRGNLHNSSVRFEQDKTGHVAFIGGSITEMSGYRPMVTGWLRERFPQTEFTFTNAGIASTCSTTGAIRLRRDVLSAGPVDLLFVEFAVNDDQDAAHSERECIRGMEGIISRVRRHNPRADIVVTHFVNPPMLETLKIGEVPLSQKSHEKVLRHWNVSSVNLGGEVAVRIAQGRLTWEVYGGTHPKPAGNRIAAELIGRLLSEAWADPLPVETAPHSQPPLRLDRYSYVNGRLVNVQTAELKRGWTIHVPEWKNIPGRLRDRFDKRQLLCASEPGSELTLKFQGTAIGAYLLAGPDAGRLEYSIDGGKFRTVDLYHRFSKGLHYPRTVIFDNELQPGAHTLRLRVSEKCNENSSGHAARILEFAVN